MEGMGQFNVTSLMPVNPLNAPDAFERRSLQKFAHSGEVEAVEIEKVGDSYRLRYMAPLEVEVQCLACHAEQGYRVGDIRGGMNVTIPMDWAFAEINNNNRMFLFIAAATVVIVSLLIFLLFNSLVSRPLRRLTSMMDAYPEQPLAPLPDNDHEDGDEIDILNREFHGLCNRLERSQHELDTTREQVFQNEKQAALGRLVAGIAHEINNPLGGMQNCVEIMRRDPQDTERNERYLALVSQGVERIKCTVQQLLNIGRKEPLAIKKGDVDAMIRDSIELCCMGHRNITRELDLQVGREVVTGMESLRQVIINLAGNAVQAIGRDQGIIRASSRLRDGRLEIVLSDNGPGIDEAILDQIFEPFFTTKEVGEGTGLGLSISHSLISRLGGSLSVANLPDGGASFHISVPIEDAE
ncbi:MAG: histidine kinase [Desulfuromonas sp.]|nr:MAG: histidine kinase [Desulfuromonas sp.]